MHYFLNFEQRLDVIELINHETLMAQLKEDMLIEKEKAIQLERNHFEQILTNERQLKFDELKDDQVVVSNLNLIINTIRTF